MNTKWIISLLIISTSIAGARIVFARAKSAAVSERFISYEADPQRQYLEFYWKNNHNEVFGSIFRLKSSLTGRNQQLLFAMNGGMYQQDQSPVGLYIEAGKEINL